jgi:hypothetical protein
MDSALPNSELKLSCPRALNSLRTSVAFLMLGGASLMIMVFLLLLRIPQVIMQDNVRYFLQLASATTLTFMILFSYPHFVWSYKFAYQQGTAFIMKHRWPLLACPLFILVLLALCVLAWNYPVSSLPLIGAIDNQLRSLGVDLHWSLYNGCGQLLLASLFICQTIMAGHHYCMQAFGVALACGEDGGYRLTTRQKQLLRFNLYALWAMNLFSGYTFFAILNNRNFVYHPPQFPPSLNFACNFVFAVSVIAVVAKVVVPVFRKTRKMPPVLAALPIFSIWIWLQPFCQPFGFQAWVVPLAHGAQYLYFAYRVENNSFDPIVERRLSTSFRGRLIYLACLTGIVVALGYVGFMFVPVMLDRERLLPDVPANFFLLAAFLFISLHHYMVDAVVWKRDSRARKLLRRATL